MSRLLKLLVLLPAILFLVTGLRWLAASRRLPVRD